MGFWGNFVDFFVGVGIAVLTFVGVPVATGPTCTIDLSASQLAWTAEEATDVTITALTDSPAVPGASQTLDDPRPFSGGLDTLFSQRPQVILQELQKNGVPNASFNPSSSGLIDGFNQTKTVANRICEVYFPGSHNTGYATKKYKSPKDNSILDFNGTTWTQRRASEYPDKGRHINRGTGFTCERSIEIPPLSGTHNFQPTLPVGTHTYRVIAQGPKGTKTCDATVVVTDDTQPDDDPDNSDNGDGSGGNGDGSGGNDSGGGSGEPQCSDGIDNDRDGAIDGADVDCESDADNNEFVGSVTSDISFSVFPMLIFAGNSTAVSWSATDVSSCSVTGTNGDSWNGSSGSENSSPIDAETTFTLLCTETDGDTVTAAETVKLVPSFQEI